MIGFGLMLLLAGPEPFHQVERAECAFTSEAPVTIKHSWRVSRQYYDDDEDDNDENKQQGDRQLSETEVLSPRSPCPSLLAKRNFFVHSCPLFYILKELRL